MSGKGGVLRVLRGARQVPPEHAPQRAPAGSGDPELGRTLELRRTEVRGEVCGGWRTETEKQIVYEQEKKSKEGREGGRKEGSKRRKSRKTREAMQKQSTEQRDKYARKTET